MKRSSSIAAAATILLIASAAPASAATRLVSPAGGAAGDCVQAACGSIQRAVDQAAGGDTVSIAAGTYSEQVVIDHKDLTIQGAGTALPRVDGTWTAGATALRPPAGGPRTTFTDDDSTPYAATLTVVDATVTLRDLWLTGGTTASPDGAAVLGLGLLRAGADVERVRLHDTRVANDPAGPSAAIGTFGGFTSSLPERPFTVRASWLTGNGIAIRAAGGRYGIFDTEITNSAVVGNDRVLVNTDYAYMQFQDDWFGSNDAPPAEQFEGRFYLDNPLTLEIGMPSRAYARAGSGIDVTAGIRLTSGNTTRVFRSLPPLAVSIAAPGFAPAAVTANLANGVAAQRLAFGAGPAGGRPISATVDGVTVTRTLDVLAPPIARTPPKITGALRMGETLTCAEGYWVGQVYRQAFRWLVGGIEPKPTATTNAGAPTYVVRAEDAGKTVVCEESVMALDNVTDRTPSAAVRLPSIATVALSAKTARRGFKLGRSLALPLRCPVATPCVVRGTIVEKRKGKLRTLATIGRTKLPASARRTVNAKLSARTLRDLRAHKGAKVTVTLVTTTAFDIAKTSKQRTTLRLR